MGMSPKKLNYLRVGRRSSEIIWARHLVKTAKNITKKKGKHKDYIAYSTAPSPTFSYHFYRCINLCRINNFQNLPKRLTIVRRTIDLLKNGLLNSLILTRL